MTVRLWRTAALGLSDFFMVIYHKERRTRCPLSHLPRQIWKELGFFSFTHLDRAAISLYDGLKFPGKICRRGGAAMNRSVFSKVNHVVPAAACSAAASSCAGFLSLILITLLDTILLVPGSLLFTPKFFPIPAGPA